MVYFEGALTAGMDNIGEKGIIKSIRALYEENDINRQYYDSTGKEDTKEELKLGLFEDIKEVCGTFFDGERLGEYNKMLDEILKLQEMQEEQENNDIEK